MTYTITCAEKVCERCGEPEGTGCILDIYLRWGRDYINICRKCYAEIRREAEGEQ